VEHSPLEPPTLSFQFSMMSLDIWLFNEFSPPQFV